MEITCLTKGCNHNPDVDPNPTGGHQPLGAIPCLNLAGVESDTFSL